MTGADVDDAPGTATNQTGRDAAPRLCSAHATGTPMTADLRDRLQTTLGSAYTVERELGGGGMSRVFVAEETRLGRRVVVKVLSPELGAGVSAERFEREIRVAARLQDARIVPVLSAGDAGGMPFYTMPFVEGESLRERMRRGPVPFAEAVAILRDIAIALDYAHRHGVIHRDIKPENVLLSRHAAVVTDFGIAKALAAATIGDGAPRATGDGVMHPPAGTLTALGMALGTPAYMAPEQATGDPVDHRADLYSWGVVAYELLGGVHPFGDRTTAQGFIAAHISETPAPLESRASALPPALTAIVERALRKDPQERPVDAAEMLAAIDSSGTDISPRRDVAARRPRSRVMPIVVGAVALVLVVASTMLVLRSTSARRSSAATGPATPRALAVLPFVNTSSDSADAYFADGMADELSTALSKVPGVRLAARSAAHRFRGSDVRLRDIGRALRVDAVLEGTVRRAGDRLRVTAQLTDASDETVLWTDRYERTSRDVFDVQDDIAHAIARELRGTLGVAGDTTSGAAPRGTADLAAYDLYLKGRFFWYRRGVEGLRNAAELFGRAVERDPGFARAHAGLAMTYVVFPFYGVAANDSALPLAEQSAARALALDSTLADAHLAMASVLRMRWRWSEAERHFRSALALAPDDPTAHQWYGGQLFTTGHTDASVEQIARASEIDPFSAALATDLVYALYVARRFDDALREGRRMVALDTTLMISHLLIGLAQLALGRPDTALIAFRTAHRLGDVPDVRGYLVATHLALGDRRAADSIYADLRRSFAAGRALGYDLAIAAAAMGEPRTALDAVRDAIERREPLLTEFSLPCEPLLDPLKRDPVYERMLAAVGMRMCPAARRAP